MWQDIQPLRDILARSYCRYLRVTPHGLQLQPDKTVPSLNARILTFRPARTLYQKRKPVCRSLDGAQSVTQKRDCADCLQRRQCTPQLCVELVADGVPLRLILAYSSARNFMNFVTMQQKNNQAVEDARVTISVINRGRWGELVFELAPADEPPSGSLK